ncbi:MAG TPA: hypothetical protein VME69_09065 [Methylocella sp.]|nr:hypothetical protein [Methylocella sp.]
MQKVIVMTAVAFIAIGAAVSSSTKIYAEDNMSGVARYNRPYPVPPSAAPPEKAYYHHPYHRRHYHHHHPHY